MFGKCRHCLPQTYKVAVLLRSCTCEDGISSSGFWSGEVTGLGKVKGKPENSKEWCYFVRIM